MECQTDESPENQESPTCDRKCLHTGDRTCYNDEFPKEVIKKIPEEKIQGDVVSSLESLSGDTLHSGESLFKTFDFQAKNDDPDLEKCMTFWKSILAKNVHPIKCTVLKKEAKPKKPKKAKKIEKDQNKDPCDCEETRKMWMEIYQDLQKKKLDKVKLIKNKKCDPCDEDFIDEEYEKKRELESIKELNHWQPKEFLGNHASKIDARQQVKRALQSLQSGPSAKSTPKSTPKHTSIKSGASSKSKVSTKSKPKETKSEEGITTIKPPESGTEDTTLEKTGEICTKCGCDIEDCICEELTSCLHDSDDDPCKICGGLDCECKLPKELCTCGCKVENCTCKEAPDFCNCGCNVDECYCLNLDDEALCCQCGCGFDGCVCQQLLTKACKCGHSDCDCDLIATLNSYLETLESCRPVPLPPDRLEEMVQTEDDEWYKNRNIQGNYCIICGHFDCNCADQNEVPEKGDY